MKVTTKGQVTIPKWVRDRYGVRPGSEVAFREVDHRVVIEKLNGGVHPFDIFYGLLKRPGSSDAIVKKMRGV